jgi:hydrogenase 3 maturation protease
VKRSPSDIFKADLRDKLNKSRRIAIVGIGDELSPVDRPGMYAAAKIARLHLPHVKVFPAGTVPESMTGPLREYKPDHVVFLDAAEMGALPGTISIIEPERTKASLVSSHVLPLSVVMEFIAEDTGARVTLLGIQPETSRRDDLHPFRGEELLRRNMAVIIEILHEIHDT